MLYRLRNTLDVLLGKKLAVSKMNQPQRKFEFSHEFTQEEQIFINSISMEFIFAEFGEQRKNAGDSEIPSENRLNPTLNSLRKYFPNAKYTVYSDFDLNINGVNLKKVEIPVPDKNNERTGHRSSVYYRIKGLLESEADFKCSIDADMYVVSSDIISLIRLTEKFGICVPYNIRQLLRQDMKMSLDTKEINDASRAMGRSYNQSPMTLWKHDERGVKYFKAACQIMKETPARGSWVMWNAAWKTGIYPYTLPKQFCVCADDEGCGDEVILHLGHQQVYEYYKSIINE